MNLDWELKVNQIHRKSYSLPALNFHFILIATPHIPNMSTLIRNVNKALVSKQVLNRKLCCSFTIIYLWYFLDLITKCFVGSGVTGLLHTSSYHGSSLPSNVEEIEAQEKVCFSSNRHRDRSQGVVQSQTASVFGASIKNNQVPQLESSGNTVGASIWNFVNWTS